MDVVRTYGKFILNPTPSKVWKVIRFGLHWITLPIKLIVIGGLGYYQIFKHRNDKRRFAEITNNKLPNPKDVIPYLPIWDTAACMSYVCRNRTDTPINGANHNPDHQCSRHGTFTFVMNQLGINRNAYYNTFGIMMSGDRLARGFNFIDGKVKYNGRTTSGDMLCGMNLAMLDCQNEAVIEKYDGLVQGIINNDFSLLENEAPDSDEVGFELWNELLKENKGMIDKVKMKSARGMWQPGLETVGAQTLTILATLKLSYKKTRNPDAKIAYDKLFNKYGYGILSLFPTAYIDKQRGYFNDHNCMSALYVLSKLAETKFEKWIYKTAMKYVWELSKHWYNGYYTGLLLDAHPELKKESKYKKHLEDCLSYLEELDWKQMMQTPISFVKKDSELVPAKASLVGEDEFYPDIQFDREIDHVDSSVGYYRSGLGYFASLVMCLKAKGILNE